MNLTLFLFDRTIAHASFFAISEKMLQPSTVILSHDLVEEDLWERWKRILNLGKEVLVVIDDTTESHPRLIPSVHRNLRRTAIPRNRCRYLQVTIHRQYYWLYAILKGDMRYSHPKNIEADRHINHNLRVIQTIIELPPPE